MSDLLLIISIGIGIFVNMISFEVLGLSLGGMVVPGYIALNLHNTPYLIFTFAIAILVFLIIRFFSNFMLIYGRRSLMLAIFFGFFLGKLFEISINYFVPVAYSVEIIGYIVPGLIAYWMERQGVVTTLAMVITGSIITRFIIIIFSGGRIPL